MGELLTGGPAEPAPAWLRADGCDDAQPPQDPRFSSTSTALICRPVPTFLNVSPKSAGVNSGRVRTAQWPPFRTVYYVGDPVESPGCPVRIAGRTLIDGYRAAPIAPAS